MKGKKSESLAPYVTSQTATKIQKRTARAKPTAAVRAAGKLLRNDQNGPMPMPSPQPQQQQQPQAVSSSIFPLPEAANLGLDGALELDGWCWDAVDEEKLLGWFPFVDEDFPCFMSENRDARLVSSGRITTIYGN
ncbi:hypothetical protein KSP40_PGU021517 [Platanthera guangdongensis]|uniref:Uncharacterized protein n=1 Tax=Platanthera guangdongensis TaxID=2320717 RepID=A0ABR2LH33_9ASPA